MHKIVGVLAVTALLFTAAPLPGTAASNGCPDPAQLPPTPFGDMAGSVHRGAVIWSDWYDIVHGTARDAFSPRTGVHRDQMAAFMARLLATAELPLPSEPPPAFSDTDGSSHCDEIAIVASLGLMDGTDDGRFLPRARVTRGDVATWLVRLAAALDVTVGDAPDAFPDDDGTPSEDAINRAVALRLVRAGGRHVRRR